MRAGRDRCNHRTMQCEAPPAVRVDRSYFGRWEVLLPDGRSCIVCDTLDDARRQAQLYAGHGHPCELVIRDAYHRVIDRETIV
jgi:hypothetical protein